MTYAMLSGGFLALALVTLGIALARASGRRALLARWTPPIAIAGIVLVVLTIVFDNLMIAAGLMQYAPAAASGPALGLMPVWDLAYPIAGVILLPSLWSLVDPKGDR